MLTPLQKAEAYLTLKPMTFAEMSRHWGRSRNVVSREINKLADLGRARPVGWEGRRIVWGTVK